MSTSFWNKGYATELTSELLRYGFEERELGTICGVVQEENDVSIKLMNRLQMDLRKEVAFDGVKLFVFGKDREG